MTVDDRRAWETVLAHIENDLLWGRLKPGDRLPGERALAADLGVGRSSVREAIRVLEVLGLVRTNVGSGPTAGAIIVALPGGGMSALMRLQVAAQGFPVADIVKTRLILETAVAAELAEAVLSAALLHPDRLDPDLTRCVQLLDAMDADGLTEDEFLALDAAFHLSLAEACGNQVVIATMAGLRTAIEGYVRAGVTRLTSWSATSVRLRAEHRGILAAIEAADPAEAHSLVHAHISGYYAETRLHPVS
ncbi:GntR family transcriptional regulator [Cryobacterium sp. SO2]|uniref:FadR/GntR family transcriptional regulator n=1 Tax=Cryobacterium sp. SO2 TaxID=1897060 RepID=UPI00223D0D5F|nr:GntR family transcriptional regulator [Cryobacterium sp. SO2]WEO77628.1 GntR family transcriptional regulator [Cryobacterium sp. SO2]